MSCRNAAALVILLLVTSILVITSSNNTIIRLADARNKSHNHPIAVSKTTTAEGKRKIITPIIQSSSLVSDVNTNKVVMINFDDGWKSQSLYAKPILDKYGFKATFFIPCAKMQTDPKWMTWQQIADLKNDEMDIESHTMTHAHLPTLLSVPSRLDYEIGGAKQCLANHGFNTTIFGYPLNLGSDIPRIVDLVAKYYDFARNGTERLMFLNCHGFTGHAYQSNCRTFSSNGNLTYANKSSVIHNVVIPSSKCFVQIF